MSAYHYLKPTVKAEPTIWNWYAWSYLIPPHTAACNIVNRHLKIMRSFIEDPHLHEEAVRNPKLIGGPFLDIPSSDLDLVKNLLAKTEENCAALIALEASIKNVMNLLLSEAKGDSLEGFYAKLPSNLQGLVELVYDINCQPNLRIIEPLLYKKFFNAKHQQIVLSETLSDFRTFVLSTPFLSNTEQLSINIQFSDKSLDTLFKSRTEAMPLEELCNKLCIPASKLEDFKAYFTTNKPSINSSNNFASSGIRIRYYGHACILIQTQSCSILIDPLISYPIQETSVPRYTYFDLPDKIDYVLITHSHQDHFMLETLLSIRHKISNIVIPRNNLGSLVDPSLKLILQYLGFENIITLEEFDAITLPEGEILALPFLGEHADLNIYSKNAYYINIRKHKFLLAADSNNLDNQLYENIFNCLGKIDYLFLGMECDGAPLSWLYGPLRTLPLKRSFNTARKLSGSDCNKAWKLVKSSGCKHAYVYAMGLEPWLGYIMALKYDDNSIQIIESSKLISLCIENGILSERLFGKKEWIIG